MRLVEYENLKALNAPHAQELQAAFQRVLESGWFILGKEVQAFEEAFANFLEVPYFLGLASGLDALELPLMALDLPPQSEIIVPSNTYIATINAIIRAGHVPIFAEPDLQSCNIDPKQIQALISPKTKAVMVVHLYGNPCLMDQIVQICNQNKLHLIEDCAQSHGATYQGKQTGTFCTQLNPDLHGAGAFSFYPTKNLGALGDAGGIALCNEELYQKIKALRNYGSHIKYHNEYVGANSRLDEVQAALLNVKLKYLPELTEHKQHLASIYKTHLQKRFEIVQTPENAVGVYHIFAIKHPERDRLRTYLANNGIKTEIHYPIAPADQNSLIKLASKGKFKLPEEQFQKSRLIHAQILSLPCSGIHTEDDIHHVIQIINNFT